MNTRIDNAHRADSAIVKGPEKRNGIMFNLKSYEYTNWSNITSSTLQMFGDESWNLHFEDCWRYQSEGETIFGDWWVSNPRWLGLSQIYPILASSPPVLVLHPSQIISICCHWYCGEHYHEPLIVSYQFWSPSQNLNLNNFCKLYHATT